MGLGYRSPRVPRSKTDWHNFEALNFPPGHPARAMQDTLYVKLGEPEQVLLRTHTSPVQIRMMETQPPPIYVVMPGARATAATRSTPATRRCSTRSRGSLVDRGITLGDLLGTIEAFTTRFFGADINSRLLPSFFPFTEPSAEFAMTCVVLRRRRLPRLLAAPAGSSSAAAGWSTPTCFAAVGIDPEEYTGLRVRLRHRPAGPAPLRHRPHQTLLDDDVRFLDAVLRTSDARSRSPGSVTSRPLDGRRRRRGVGA